MKNNQKNFVIPLIIAITVLLVIGGGVYVYIRNESVIKVFRDTSDWKVYTNKEYGFEFRTPNDYVMSVLSFPDMQGIDILASAPNNKYLIWLINEPLKCVSCNEFLHNKKPKGNFIINNITWDDLGFVDECDAEGCGPDLYIYRTIHNNFYYYVLLYSTNQTEGFLKTFEFTKSTDVCFDCGGKWFPSESYQPNPTTTDNIVGNDRDEHGCIGSAGYSWCEVKNKCLRVWEEKCEATPASTCNCPEGYIQEGETCNPKCYYSTPKCLMPSVQCVETEITNIARINQEVVVNGISIKPLEILEDSRCPTEVQCIWAGTVKLNANINGQIIILTLGTPQTIAGKQIELIKVLPVKTLATILPADYSFEFSVK